MEIVKRINTSAVLCIDGNGRQLVAFGRGLGFKDVGDELPLSEIQRTFYNVSSRYIALIDEVSDELLELTSDVIDMSTGLLPYEVSPNLPFILADHIAYAIKRKEQNIVVHMPLSFDVRHQYTSNSKSASTRVEYSGNVSMLGFPLMRQLELPWRLSITWPIRIHVSWLKSLARTFTIAFSKNQLLLLKDGLVFKLIGRASIMQGSQPTFSTYSIG